MEKNNQSNLSFLAKDDPMPRVLTVKEETLNDFMRVGIDQKIANSFLTSCESVLQRDSSLNWIHHFIHERHNHIQDPEILADAGKYMAALGFKDFPPCDPFVAKRESLLNFALQHAYESLLVVEGPLLGADLSLNNWHLVNANANTEGAEPNFLAIFVTDEPSKIWETTPNDVKEKITALQRLNGTEEFWYHGTSLVNATAIVESGIDRTACRTRTDFSRDPAFYLNFLLRGEFGAVHWCCSNYWDRAKSSAILIYALPPAWRNNQDLQR